MLQLQAYYVSAIGNTNVSIKDTLARSLTKVREMLVDIEDKIKEERKILSKIDRDLSHKGGQVILDENLDYHNIDIMWQFDNRSTVAKGAWLC